MQDKVKYLGKALGHFECSCYVGKVIQTKQR